MRRASAVGVMLLVAGAGAVASCTKVSSDPNVVVALVFDSLPYPAVVAGDTLRDENGTAIPLRAVALNVDGNPIIDAPTTFILQDPGATVSAEGFLVASDPAVTSIRVIAQTSALQSRPLTLVVTPRPDSIALDGTVDTLRYVLPDAQSNTSTPISVRVFSNTTTPPVAARGWIVRYSLEYHGAPLPVDGAQLAWLIDDSNRRSTEDTTSSDGRAARRVRVMMDTVHTASSLGIDSIVVIATASRSGVPLIGSPLRIQLPLKAK